VAARKLDMLDAAVRLDELRWPPGNQLEGAQERSHGTVQHPGQQAMARLFPVDVRRA
jgi:hypothetical protein